MPVFLAANRVAARQFEAGRKQLYVLPAMKLEPKTWDSPRAGTVPVLLTATLKRAPFTTVPRIAFWQKKIKNENRSFRAKYLSKQGNARTRQPPLTGCWTQRWTFSIAC